MALQQKLESSWKTIEIFRGGDYTNRFLQYETTYVAVATSEKLKGLLFNIKSVC